MKDPNWRVPVDTKIRALGFVWEFIKERNRMECNDHKGVKKNEIYLSEGNKWNRIK